MVAKLDLILLMQLLLLFWIPPIVFNQRTIFLSDLWNWLWVPFGLVLVLKKIPKKRQNEVLFFLTEILLVFLLSWVHGSTRPLLGDELRKIYHLDFFQTENFQPLKEFINAFRFLIWTLSFWLVFHLSLKSKKLNKQVNFLFRAFGLVLLAYFFFCILEQFSPSFRNSYYLFYGVDPNYLDWKLRSFGLLRSPHEAAAVFATSYFLFTSFFKQRFQLPIFLVTILGIALTRSATVGVAFLIAFGVLLFLKNRKNTFAKVVFLSLISALVFCTYLFRDHPQVRVKFIDFNYRLGPWKFYLTSLCSKWDSFLFGFGYPPYHVDNSYLWVLTRVGFLGFFTLGFFLITGLKRIWKNLDLPLKTLFLFIVLSGLALDFWIYRPFLNVMIVLGMPLLALNSSKNLLYRENHDL